MSCEVLLLPTLVLNRNWQPVHVTTVYRALAMLWSETAHVICPESYELYTWQDWVGRSPSENSPVIRTGKLKMSAPEVVRLGDYYRQPNHAVTFTRSNLMKRDHHSCQYCGRQPGRGKLTIDHVVPRSKGGPNSWTNCVAACVKCNAEKADRTLEQVGPKLRLKRKPVRPDWKPFWSAQGVRISVWEQFIPKQDGKPLMRVFG